MEAVRLRARVGPDRQLTWLEPLPPLSEGEVEVILLYKAEQEDDKDRPLTDWPVLDGGRYLGGTVRREEIYDDAR
jgi:hypothetical protein